jgi:hypothetical protein
MQSGTSPEDIHTILSRFSNWTGEQTANGNGHGKGLDAGVREIPYEEALRRVRSRRGGGAASTAAQVAAPVAHPVSALRAEPAQKPMPAQGRASKAAKLGAQVATENNEAVRPTRKSKTRVRKAAAPEFCNVLAKQVREKLSAQAKKAARSQRVSVRLSRAEERSLQELATSAGVTMSEFLRMRALETAMAKGATADAPRRKTAIKAAPEPVKQARNGLGDWITLLRNRFLASPVRFAERA